ncbi:cysteine proteinase, partial [Auricularia subglabra TFB-10046 SS5]
IIKFPDGRPGHLAVRRRDLATLEPACLLNDTMLEFGFRYWYHNLHRSHPWLAQQMHIFSSFLFTKLADSLERRPKEISHWTKKVDIFAKRYVIFPINENRHWYLAILCQPDLMLHSAQNHKRYASDYSLPSRTGLRAVSAKLLVFDSLAGNHSGSLKMLSKYLCTEALRQRGVTTTGNTIEIIHAPVPLQDNFSDCGLYALHFAETFMLNTVQCLQSI